MNSRKNDTNQESSLFYELKSRIQATETDVKYIHRDIREIAEKLDNMIDKLDRRFVTQDQFIPVRNLVFGAASIILVAVITALVYLVVK